MESSLHHEDTQHSELIRHKLQSNILLLINKTHITNTFIDFVMITKDNIGISNVVVLISQIFEERNLMIFLKKYKCQIDARQNVSGKIRYSLSVIPALHKVPLMVMNGNG